MITKKFIFYAVPGVMFFPSEYNIVEGNTVELSIVLNISAAYNVFVTVRTEDGLSIGNYLCEVI